MNSDYWELIGMSLCAVALICLLVWLETRPKTPSEISNEEFWKEFDQDIVRMISDMLEKPKPPKREDLTHTDFDE